VVCSKAKISLRKRESGKHRPSFDILLERTHHAIPLKLPETAVRRLRQEAVKRGLPVATFVSMLLKMITQDNLYDAVLDEPKAGRSGRRQGSS
jgi:predicted DNA binding CopG/RHH family protein